MKRFACALLSILMLIAGQALADGEETKGLKKDVVILFTGDIHGGANMGLTLGAVPNIRDYYAQNNHVILADLGDAYQGDLACSVTEGGSMVGLMSYIGYDVNTIGNHDFAFGIEPFLDYQSYFSQETVCANFLRDGEPFYKPYFIKEFDGVKIAFVGALIPTTETIVAGGSMKDKDGHAYSFAADGTGQELARRVQTAVDEARKAGADYVILLSHLGISENDKPYTCTELIANTTGIDAVLDGHSHDSEHLEIPNKDGKIIQRQACGTKMQAVGWLRIGKDGKITTGLHRWTNGITAQKLLGFQSDVSYLTNAIDALVDEFSGVKVGETKHDLCIADEKNKAEDGSTKRIVRTHETNLGDLIADAYRFSTDADAAVIQGGGIRDRIGAGSFTYKDVFNVRPFLNKVFLTNMTGQELLDMLEFSVHSLPAEFGGFLQVSGLTFDVRTDIPSPVKVDEQNRFVSVSGERRVQNVLVNGEPLDVNKVYKVAGPDTLFGGLDGYPKDPQHVQLLSKPPIDLDMLTEFFDKAFKGVIGDEYADPYGQGRIRILSGAADDVGAAESVQPSGEKKAA